MTAVPYGVALVIEFRLLAHDEGGRSTPVMSGLRPLCRFIDPDGQVITVGMCQLELHDVDRVAPGASGSASLVCAPDVSELVRRLARVGTEFELAEGNTVIGRALVRGVH
jgi:hypothetical protein